MQTEDLTLVCNDCNHKADYRMFLYIGPRMQVICQNSDSCKRRQKRTAVIKEMESRNAVHPVDRFSRNAIKISAVCLLTIVAICGAYLWLGI